MNRTQILIMLLLSLSLLGLKQIDNYSKVPKTLKGTNWTSQFFHYCNYYHFETDSTGFSEDGQVARSCPIDTLALGVSGDEIIYAEPEEFKYIITDTILTIEYLTWRPNDTIHKRTFYHRPDYKGYISGHEYAYGKECLIMGERKEKI